MKHVKLFDCTGAKRHSASDATKKNVKKVVKDGKEKGGDDVNGMLDELVTAISKKKKRKKKTKVKELKKKDTKRNRMAKTRLVETRYPSKGMNL